MTTENKMTFTEDEIEKMKAKLSSLPIKKKEKTKQEVVAELKDEIEDLRKRGYTFDDICDSLKETGLTISTPTLRKYLSSKKKTSSNSTMKKQTNKKESSEKKIESEKRTYSTFDIKEEDDL